MEKSWENFWTTGKVEDYLTYRNRATMKETEDARENYSEASNWHKDSTTEKNKSSWKGFT